jgi:hypothetical protein
MQNPILSIKISILPDKKHAVILSPVFSEDESVPFIGKIISILDLRL